MSTSTWLEVALNGPWGRARQPNIPLTVDAIVAEGVACAEAGAAIVHVHAYDTQSGRQHDDWQTYARIIEGVRARVDAIVYPTIPFPGALGDASTMTGAERYGHTAELAKRGLLEWSVVDPGSCNIVGDEEVAGDAPGLLYVNPDEHIRAGMVLAANHGFHPGFAIYEPGFLRLGAAYEARYRDAPPAVYRFMFSDAYRFGFPPRVWALDAYLALLAECRPGAPWMVAGLRVDVSPLTAAVVARGGHVRVGLEDAPHGDARSNLDWVNAARVAIEGAGGALADAPTVRAALAQVDKGVPPVA